MKLRVSKVHVIHSLTIFVAILVSTFWLQQSTPDFESSIVDAALLYEDEESTQPTLDVLPTPTIDKPIEDTSTEPTSTYVAAPLNTQPTTDPGQPSQSAGPKPEVIPAPEPNPEPAADASIEKPAPDEPLKEMPKKKLWQCFNRFTPKPWCHDFLREDI